MKFKQCWARNGRPSGNENVIIILVDLVVLVVLAQYSELGLETR